MILGNAALHDHGTQCIRVHLGSFKPGTHQTDGRLSGSVRRASLFGVFHSSALVGLMSAVVCPAVADRR